MVIEIKYTHDEYGTAGNIYAVKNVPAVPAALVFVRPNGTDSIADLADIVLANSFIQPNVMNKTTLANNETAYVTLTWSTRILITELTGDGTSPLYALVNTFISEIAEYLGISGGGGGGGVTVHNLLTNRDAADAHPESAIGNLEDRLTTIEASLDTNAMFLKTHPVGSIYLTVEDEDPGSKYGGSWTLFGAGRVPTCVDKDSPFFNTLEKQAGVISVTLTLDDIPAHSHPYTATFVGSGAKNSIGSGSAYASGQSVSMTDVNMTRNNPIAILQPYITCFIYKRLA